MVWTHSHFISVKGGFPLPLGPLKRGVTVSGSKSIGNISCHSLLVKAASLQVIGENYCFIFFYFFSKRNLEKLDTVVFVEGNGTLVLNYFHRPCQASTLTIQRRDFLKTTLISKWYSWSQMYWRIIFCYFDFISSA